MRLQASSIALLALVMANAQRASAAPAVPSSFVVENAVSNGNFSLPTCMAFLPDGRMLVGEKMGQIWLVDHGLRTASVWNGEPEINAAQDCGLMSIAVDPQFTVNRFVYFLYAVDPDSNGVDTEAFSFGRLTRYQLGADDALRAIPDSRTILMGVDWSHAPLIAGSAHGVGSLRWGSDGSLLVSIGDGAYSNRADAGGLYPDGFGPGRTDSSEDIGAFRARDPASLSGKVLRIDPQTGLGYPSNPFYQANAPDSPGSRVWALGMRNPFRMALRPGSGHSNPALGAPGTMFIGDVGWLTWEEVNVAREAGQDFGWPCMEGVSEQDRYVLASPTHHACDSTVAGWATPPAIAWHHTDPALAVPEGSALSGNCAMVGAFYSGTRYPEPFRDALFFADFGGNWIRVAKFDERDRLVDVREFATDTQGPVDFATDPVTGDLHYVSITGGQVLRVRYVESGTNDPGVSTSVDRSVGVAPLTVRFSSAGTFSPIERPLTLTWSFGDGTGAYAGHPTHVYNQPGVYKATLTVSDDLGNEARDTLVIVATNGATFPTTRRLDSFDREDGPLGDLWTGRLIGVAIRDSQLVQSTGLAMPVWREGWLGSTQEAYVTLNALTQSPHHTLLLKVQGEDPATGNLQVRYHHAARRLSVATFTPGIGWITHGIIDPFMFEPGERFGARAYPNGIVEVYRNSEVVGTFSVAGWPYSGGGGRVGLVLENDASSRLDDFGGGTADLGLNRIPVATILEPRAGSFYVAGIPIVLTGEGTDVEDVPDLLHYQWRVDQHHNNHTHPAVFTSEARSATYATEDHDDGTGTHLDVQLRVTDTEGATGEASVELHPEVDLEPSVVTAQPLESDGGGLEFRFQIMNHGRMRAPASRWTLAVDGDIVAQGDTIVPALGNVTIARRSGPLTAGTHAFAITVDAPGAITETDESNNEGAHSLSIHPSFPSTRILDPFDRADGELGGYWLGNDAAMVVADSALGQNGPPSPSSVWGGLTFGPDQEAYLTFATIAPACRRYCLMLKVQGDSIAQGGIEVRYDGTLSTIQVGTHQPGVGAKLRGTIPSVRFADGDRFGARARRDGTVEVFRNAISLGTISTGNWSLNAQGGRLGINLAGATGSRLEDFGGGTFTDGPNLSPEAAIGPPGVEPYCSPGDTVWLSSTSADGEESIESLKHEWRGDLVHGDREELGVFRSERRDDYWVLADPEGGGSWRVVLKVTDSGGLSSTRELLLLPESARPDHTPPVFTGRPDLVAFDVIARVRWQTNEAATGRVWWAPAATPADSSALEAPASTQQQFVLRGLEIGTSYWYRVTATDSSGNATTTPVDSFVTRAEPVGTEVAVPRAIELSSAMPNPSSTSVALKLALPEASEVEVSVLDVQGRLIWRLPARPWAAGQREISWPGLTASGSRARAGVYVAMVRVGNLTLSRRIAIVR